MTIFLLEFDRSEHRLVRSPERFDVADLDRAFQSRLEAQAHALAEDLDRDIVLLEAESEEDLRRTHGSFFFTPEQLGAQLKKFA